MIQPVKPWLWAPDPLPDWPLYRAEVDGQTLWIRAPSSIRALQCALIEFDTMDSRCVVRVEAVR